MENRFSPIPLFEFIFPYKMVRWGFKSIDLGVAVILVFVLFENINFCFSKLAGTLELDQCVFAKMDVRSYPFGDWLVNQASWTPGNFGRYPKCPKWSSQSCPMTDFVRKSRRVRPHHPSLFLSLHNGSIPWRRRGPKTNSLCVLCFTMRSQSNKRRL